MKLSYRRRIIVVFSVILTVFTVGVVLFERQQIKNERTESLERMLETNAEIIHNFLKDSVVSDSSNIAIRADKILKYLSPELRVTVIDWQGNVLSDNVLDETEMENHLQRPEIQKALSRGFGANIRRSDSDNIKYLYYAKKFEDGLFIRVSLPYDVDVDSFINSKNTFVYFILLFFIVCVAMMLYFANRFSESIKKLREFSLSLKNEETMPSSSFSFSDDEVGEVSAAIAENYNLLQENRRKLSLEREKLLQHFHYSEEGIAIFSKERKKIYANSYFLQFLNIITDKPMLEIENLFSCSEFEEFVQFLETEPRDETMFTKRIEKSGRQFNVRLLIFDDESFEFYISDVTKSEKTRLLKHEMTNNIAHELRTPVTGMRGYLETLKNLDENDVERRNNFIERAYIQSIRLSELIQDISMLTKIEEASSRFEKERVQMRELLEDLGLEMAGEFKEKNIQYIVDVNDDVIIYGSRTLLYSIFRNLTDNSVAYAGDNIEIVIRCYNESADTYYFEFYDTGIGVEEKHLRRIFERFYRVSEGRTRKTGGSGLGLSIVKNAILFHNGNIIAKNRPEGGLSFWITFPKKNNK